MALVFSTSDLGPAQRVEATCAAMHEQSVPCTVELENPSDVRARMDVWPYGNANIFRAEMNGFRLVRTAKQIATAPAEMFAIAVHEKCTGKREQFGVQRTVPADELMVMDLNSPYDYVLEGGGAARCLHVPVDALGLPREVIETAADRLPASPLYSMAVHHIAELTDNADALSADVGADALGEASIELTRALIASAYGLDYARSTLAEMLLPRIRSYVKQHLGDPNLSIESIAAAHDISQRHLFKLCAAAGFSLEQWMISERLTHAREDLSRAALRGVSVTTIARRWGFTNTSHFIRRFRMMYGLSPGAWRELSDERTVEADEQ
ncbi:helix-turn-helix domain-containing protein [Williamsia soli]|uniref:helix-turn-helix domain-containing protein n=1 Tax=Williamsia soli TaxID=364929 RepID=UPI001A9E92EC|nr:helix-turn-helix domain-containing protein [Williamsia soli]